MDIQKGGDGADRNRASLDVAHGSAGFNDAAHGDMTRDDGVGNTGQAPMVQMHIGAADSGHLRAHQSRAWLERGGEFVLPKLEWLLELFEHDGVWHEPKRSNPSRPAPTPDFFPVLFFSLLPLAFCL